MDPILALIEGLIPEHVVSFEGTSQYTQGGTSTCGLAALNAVRIILGSEQRGIDGVKLLRRIASKEMIDEIVEICAAWSSQLHLEVDDISALPLFDNTLSLSFSEYNQAEPKNFTAFLRHLEEIGRTRASASHRTSSAVVITRPPEILAVFHIPIHSLEQSSVFVVFDSHPRPAKHTEGASFILFSTIESTSQYISSLLQVDQSLLNGLGSMQWQAQLLGHYSGHGYVARNSYDFNSNPARAIYDANMAILEVKFRLAEAEDKVRSLTAENTTLQERLAQVQAQPKFSPPSKAFPEPSHSHDPHKPSHNHPSPPVAGPSTPRKTVQRDRPDRPRSPSGANQERADAALAARLYREESTQLASLELARRTQEKLDIEDDELNIQMAQLKKMAQVLFECTICFENYPEDYVARVDVCGHELCRECMKDFVVSKLEEHRYPIVCPLCQVDNNAQDSDPGVITGDIVDQMGLSEAQNATWIELELSQFSIVLDCPKCQRSTFVDLTDHTDMKLIQCPLPDCHHVWCKSCQRHVEPGTRHSCDGTLELDDLMKNRGWRKCPGCQTPAAKESGCNHMTCPARGCNTHFCYVCGESIVQSVRARDIRPALNQHYTRCHLFEDVPDRNVA